MSPWNVTVTIKPSEGSLAAVTDLIVIATRSAAVSPGRWTIEYSAPVTIPARAGAQITAEPIAITARPNAAKLPHPKGNISSLRCTPSATDQSASATQKFQPRATQTHTPMLLESSKRALQICATGPSRQMAEESAAGARTTLALLRNTESLGTASRRSRSALAPRSLYGPASRLLLLRQE